MEVFRDIFMELFREDIFSYHTVDANEMMKRSRRQQKAATKDSCFLYSTQHCF